MKKIKVTRCLLKHPIFRSECYREVKKVFQAKKFLLFALK